MPLADVFQIAGSAMSAQTTRLNLVASNLANAESVSSSTDQTYRSRQPVFATVLQNALDSQQQTAQGVKVLGIVESNAPLRQEYAPLHPMADPQGYVYKSNVNTVEEMANMMAASRAYQNNVEMLNTTKQLMQQTLRIGQ